MHPHQSLYKVHTFCFVRHTNSFNWIHFSTCVRMCVRMWAYYEDGDDYENDDHDDDEEHEYINAHKGNYV